MAGDSILVGQLRFEQNQKVDFCSVLVRLKMIQRGLQKTVTSSLRKTLMSFHDQGRS